MTAPVSSIDFGLPPWVEALVAAVTATATVDERMRLVIEAARLNVENATGGPFAAAVFDRDSGRLVSLGVNLVERTGLSVLHAEVVALMLAQRRTGAFDLSAAGLAAHELVSSAEPCAMCLGAVPWSGVRRLVTGARGEDVELAGFDEGAKPADWCKELEKRGIDVVRDTRRAEAAAVITDYCRRGGLIYNPSGG